MKLLKAENNQGHFLADNCEFCSIDKITKDDLLRLSELVLEEESIELDPYTEDSIRNEAHRILYQNIISMLEGLRERRQEFVDQRDKLFQEAYATYRDEVQNDPEREPADAAS
ncbi:MAG: hypothetical protein AAGF84_09425 [Planctomycetota bacterium]